MTTETCPWCGAEAEETEPGASYCDACCLDWATGSTESRAEAWDCMKDVEGAWEAHQALKIQGEAHDAR